LPIGWDKWIAWQFTDNFYFPGCNCAADGNWFNGTLDQMRIWFKNYREVTPPPARPFQARSLFEGLHIRQLPNINAKEVGHLSKGEVVDVLDFSGADAWIRHPLGWTAVEINGYRYMEVFK
jgi:hypothetical protein